MAAAVDVRWDAFFDPRQASSLLDVLGQISEAHLATSETELSPASGLLLERLWAAHVASLHQNAVVSKVPAVIAAVPTVVGRPYVPVGVVPSTKPRDPFAVDPDVIDRGNQAHASTQDALAQFVRDSGFEPRQPQPDEPQYDLAWTGLNRVFVAEVKSITEANEESQLRLGLGQVLRYRHELARSGREIIAVLVAERAPHEPAWAELCASLSVVLVWPGAFVEVLSQRMAANAAPNVADA